MHENKFNSYKVPSGLLILFLEKALTLIHMETHLTDSEEPRVCKVPFSLLTPHNCDVQGGEPDLMDGQGNKFE